MVIRCVLSMSLVLNGLGTGAAAHAGALHAAAAPQHAGGKHAATVTTETATGAVPADAAASTERPCHGGHAARAADDSQPAKDHGSVLTDDSDSRPECCRDAGCAGACLQHSPAATVLGIPFAVVTPASVDPASGVPHSLPEWPPLTRPPDA